MAVYFMPIPNTTQAPKFDGHFVEDFLEDIEMHLNRANIVDEDQRVGCITRYSTEAIRQRIALLPEFNRSKNGKTWDEASTLLIDIYGDVDKSRPLPFAAFEEWIREQAGKPVFRCKAQVNAYYIAFMSKGQPLVDANLLVASHRRRKISCAAWTRRATICARSRIPSRV
ncbi:hypothetical protein C8Q80DRAFT_1202838 [Daedaleopsis nitida]|nr:hypothetical protein C8Q80DRAFT_1202838 [Daedaleopsis nitida]